ncbi:AP2 domain-containing protein [Aquisphaera insulae]|uniref:AP2 domain-containing protein n=1 Tax=Aquisphaera insulae TaxID=2712864 RepID=UPI00196A43B4|nr:AP2 domain-containing protein [Aquisphaera insulae]
MVAPYRWYAKLDRSTGRFYAYNRSHRLIMHRVIFGAKKGDPMVDHIDQDGLNNRRGNLRSSNDHLNQINRGKKKNSVSRYKGVSWNTRKQRWVVRFSWLGKDHYVGAFKDERIAAQAYNEAVLPLAGEHARLNVIDWSAEGSGPALHPIVSAKRRPAA